MGAGAGKGKSRTQTESPPGSAPQQVHPVASVRSEASTSLSESDPNAQKAVDLKPQHLSSWKSGLMGMVDERHANRVVNPMAHTWPDMNFLNPEETVQGHIIMNDSKAKQRAQELSLGCVRANACYHIWWNPSEVKAAIVTAGGLCPGLNSIIREVTSTLISEYGVNEVWGIKAGYNGLSDPDTYPPMRLTRENTRDIHMKGGSILQAGRGGFDAKKICDTLRKKGINMLFVVGGDGTQFAGHLLAEAAKEENLPVSIVGVPKSIDNDVLYFDKTFGFDSAVASASEVIRNGWVEASSCSKGVGIVKLMGRDAGFVAMHAALASDIVDLVLIPEVPWKLEDVQAYVDERIAEQGYMVIAVAEGAGQEYVATGEKDKTGHTIYGDIGVFLRDNLNKYLKEKGGRTFYIDPSYIIRSVPVRPNDHIYCSRLAHDAVHCAMRGYTGVCVGAIHNVIIIMPSKLIAKGKKKVSVKSSAWQSCVQSCGMPHQLAGRA